MSQVYVLVWATTAFKVSGRLSMLQSADYLVIPFVDELTIDVQLELIVCTDVNLHLRRQHGECCDADA